MPITPEIVELLEVTAKDVSDKGALSMLLESPDASLNLSAVEGRGTPGRPSPN
jgi:hypothetical protein